MYHTHAILTNFAKISLKLIDEGCRENGSKNQAGYRNSIRKYRRMMDLSQEQLAALMRKRGCTTTRSSLSRIELGSYNIKASELIAICDILGVSPNKLIQK